MKTGVMSVLVFALSVWAAGCGVPTGAEKPGPKVAKVSKEDGCKEHIEEWLTGLKNGEGHATQCFADPDFAKSLPRVNALRSWSFVKVETSPADEPTSWGGRLVGRGDVTVMIQCSDNKGYRVTYKLSVQLDETTDPADPAGKSRWAIVSLCGL